MRPEPRSSPLVVAGMHASGTSLAASLLAGLGASFGERLVPPDRHNPEGYFEDLDFVALQGRLMHAATRADEPGHRDWGWTESEFFDHSAVDSFRPDALELLSRKQADGQLWGWKNPRTSITLDFWHRLVPEARYLLIYRFPWEVADSLQRLGAEVFLRNPDYAYRIWNFYNQRLLTFFREWPERCLLVSANALLHSPDRMDELLRESFGLDVPQGFVASRIHREIFRSDDGQNPLVTLLETVRPNCLDLLRELDGSAALPATGLWGPAELVTRAPASPRVSVLIPCYNHGEFLLEAIASAERAASECPLEVVIVNDGSDQPWTVEVLSGMRLLGYRVHDQGRRGLPGARNAGLARARADYLLPLDADDRLRPDFVRLAVDLLDAEPSVGVAYGDYWKFGLRTELAQPPPFSLTRLLCGNFVAACALIRRRLLEDCGGWDEQMAAWEDWELWIAAASRGWQFRHLDTIAFDYRQRPDSMVTACARAEFGEPLQNYIVNKHRAAYLEQMPKILMTVQDSIRSSTAASAAYAQRIAALEAESSAASRKAAQERSRLENLVDHQSTELADFRRQLSEVGDRLRESEMDRHQLHTELAEVGARLVDSELERHQLVDQRYRLYEELRAWAERVAAMERTAAWRARRLLIRVRRSLRL